MFIARMNKGSWGKIRAFFDVQTEEGFTIKGFKLVESVNGLFVGFPSNRKSPQEAYQDTIWAERELKAQVTLLAKKVYASDDGEKCQDNYVEIGQTIGGIKLIRGHEASNMVIEQKSSDYQERVEASHQDPSEELPF